MGSLQRLLIQWRFAHNKEASHAVFRHIHDYMDISHAFLAVSVYSCISIPDSEDMTEAIINYLLNYLGIPVQHIDRY